MMYPKPKRIRNRKALEAARRDRCEVCGNRWGLQIHHIKSRGSGGHDEPQNLICLCVACHNQAHNGKLKRETLQEIVRRRETWKSLI